MTKYCFFVGLCLLAGVSEHVLAQRYSLIDDSLKFEEVYYVGETKQPKSCTYDLVKNCFVKRLKGYEEIVPDEKILRIKIYSEDGVLPIKISRFPNLCQLWIITESFNYQLFESTASDLKGIYLNGKMKDIPFVASQVPALRELVLVGYNDYKEFNLKGLDNLERLDLKESESCSSMVPGPNHRDAVDGCLSLPEDILNLPSLKILGLYGFSYDYPDWVEQLTNLNTLFLETPFVSISTLKFPNKINVLYTPRTTKMFDIYNAEVCLLKSYFPGSENHTMTGKTILNKKNIDDYYGNCNCKKNGKKKLNTKTYENGRFSIKYKEGQVAIEGYMKNGQPDSTWIYYSCTGDTVSVRRYREGEYYGEWIFGKYGLERWVFENGELKYIKTIGDSVRNYKNGLLDGYSAYWKWGVREMALEYYEAGKIIWYRDIPVDESFNPEEEFKNHNELIRFLIAKSQ